MQSQWHPVSRNLSHSTELPFSSQNLVSLLYVGPAAALISSPRYKLLPYSALQIPYLRPSSALSRSPCTNFWNFSFRLDDTRCTQKTITTLARFCFSFLARRRRRCKLGNPLQIWSRATVPKRRGSARPDFGTDSRANSHILCKTKKARKKKHAYQGPSTKAHARGASRTWAGFCNAKICVVPLLPVGTCVDENPPSFPTPLSTRIKGTFPTIIVRIVLPHSKGGGGGGVQCAAEPWNCFLCKFHSGNFFFSLLLHLAHLTGVSRGWAFQMGRFLSSC